MFAKWSILSKRMDTGEFNATSFVKAVCDLRNLLLEHEAPDCGYVSIEAEQVHSRPARHLFVTRARKSQGRLL